ncbi:hypothetical protein F5B22DRAFT_558971 [Xylaria bambusicola]|uniref:uncharacterized protein n=1 Tax=Xylaria bambusicola TaxID=326684 RepID=UPI0020076F9A|nr:uncharacterized protein F5B22DRAFT_558971 [Xylaria bambusicola]KAI0503246.1 hypothetical protein F5B22DRAFT_558971 [Xylaria bambusicola]
MPEYEYVRRSPSPFIRSRSFSYQTRPRHCRLRCPENCACVSVEEWNELAINERTARESADNLRTELRATSRENNRLQATKRELQAELEQLRGHGDAVAKFKRRMAKLAAEVEGLRKEKEVADIRIREISQTVTDKNLEIDQLQEENRQLARIHKRDKQETREAWKLVTDLQRRLHDCRHVFGFPRPYGYA